VNPYTTAQRFAGFVGLMVAGALQSTVLAIVSAAVLIDASLWLTSRK